MTNVLRANAVGAVLVAALFWTVAPDSPVADAAERGDVEAVRALVKQGADVNAAQGDGMTALHWAAVNGNAEMAEVLVAAGASTAASTRLGRYTPLHLASERGNAAVVSALLAAGANPNAETSTGAVTPLLFAAGSGDVATITALLNGGADVNRADRQWGHTALMFAAERNRVAAVKVLVERGADPAITGRVIDVAKRARAAGP
jgi:ankyrin repeat protein